MADYQLESVSGVSADVLTDYKTVLESYLNSMGAIW